jgi:hypothetical protein
MKIHQLFSPVHLFSHSQCNLAIIVDQSILAPIESTAYLLVFLPSLLLSFAQG